MGVASVPALGAILELMLADAAWKSIALLEGWRARVLVLALDSQLDCEEANWYKTINSTTLETNGVKLIIDTRVALL
eukprot:3805464-Amphidinium_carterae.1